MRKYAIVSPNFWTGQTGRKLRSRGVPAPYLALYLLTTPHANMLGLYYLPKSFISHETGMTTTEVNKAFVALSAENFARYDDDSEFVWVPKMAEYQIGPNLELSDNRIPAVNREYLSLPVNPFLASFYDLYHDRFWLDRPHPACTLNNLVNNNKDSCLREDKEREQEQEQEHGGLEAPLKPLRQQQAQLTPKKVMDLYNKYCPDLRRCDGLDAKRERMIRALVRRFDEQWFTETFEHANTAQYCRGEKDGKVWGIENVMRNYVEIREGKYDKVYSGETYRGKHGTQKKWKPL